MKSWITIVVLALLLGVFTVGIAVAQEPSSNIIADHNSVALYEQIPPEYLAAAQALTVLYTDRSVGANLSEGLDCLSLAYPGLAHCRRTVHLDSKYSSTAADLLWVNMPSRANLHFDRLNLCTDLECTKAQYDANPTQVVGLFSSYLENYTDEQLRKLLDDLLTFAQSRGATLMVFTPSVARDGDCTELVCLLGLARQAETTRMWAAEHGVPLLDAHDILSNDIDGTSCYDGRDGVPYINDRDFPPTVIEDLPDDGIDAPAICQRYTTEFPSGHLGTVSVGKIRLAKAYWVLLAQLAGWQPDVDATPTPTVTIAPDVTPTPTATATSEPVAACTKPVAAPVFAPIPENEWMNMRAQAAEITPLDADGNPDPNGKIGALVIGHSITQRTCDELAKRQWPTGTDPHVEWVCGAQAGKEANEWADPNSPVWAEVDVRLAQAGLTRAQVQVVWMKLAYIWAPRVDQQAEYTDRLTNDYIATQLGIEARFPNLQITYALPLFPRHTDGTTGETSNMNAAVWSRAAVEQFRDRYFDEAVVARGLESTNAAEALGVKAVIIGPDVWPSYSVPWPAAWYHSDCVHLSYEPGLLEESGYQYPARSWSQWMAQEMFDRVWWLFEGTVIYPTATPTVIVDPTIIAPPTTVMPPTITPTATPTATATPTVASTATPTATVTQEPTSEPPPTGIDYCPTHDATKWHALYDGERNCWYDHYHGDNPRQVDDVFGDWYMNLTATEPGNEIDPFWNPQPGDNAHHMTMHWFAGKRECVATKFSSGTMTAWRVLAHYQSDNSDFIGVTDGIPHGTFHTVWAEFETCLMRDDGTIETGIVRYGGAQYAGDIFVDNAVLLDFPDLRDMFPGTKASRAQTLAYCNVGGKRTQVWYPTNAEGLVRVSVEINDAWGSGCIDPANPTAVDFNEGANQSVIGLHVLGLDFRQALRPRLDPDGDGYVDGMWYMTEVGTFNGACVASGPNCIPVYFEHVPIPPDAGARSHYQLRLGTNEYDTSIGVLPVSPLVYPGDKE